MPRQCGAGLRAQEVPLRSVVGTTAARVECHDARVADESDDSAAEPDVLTNLPRTRPARRSARRASAASEPKPKRAPAKPAAAKRRATPKPQDRPGRGRGATRAAPHATGARARAPLAADRHRGHQHRADRRAVPPRDQHHAGHPRRDARPLPRPVARRAQDASTTASPTATRPGRTSACRPDAGARRALLRDRAQDGGIALVGVRVDVDHRAALVALVDAHLQLTDAQHRSDPRVLREGGVAGRLDEQVGPEAADVDRAADELADPRDRRRRHERERRDVRNPPVLLHDVDARADPLGELRVGNVELHPLGMHTVVGEFVGARGIREPRAEVRQLGSSRIVSHGNELRTRPSRTNAQRRSPSTPCHETSASSSASPPIDLTG